MELMIKAAWAGLALLHAPPAAALFAPGLVRRLYGVDPSGEIGLLLTHRAALFAAVALAAAYAVVDPASRRLASLVVGMSMIAFLALYVTAGAPQGSLRVIALADAAGLPLLALCLWAAWQS